MTRRGDTDVHAEHTRHTAQQKQRGRVATNTPGFNHLQRRSTISLHQLAPRQAVTGGGNDPSSHTLVKQTDWRIKLMWMLWCGDNRNTCKTTKQTWAEDATLHEQALPKLGFDPTTHESRKLCSHYNFNFNKFAVVCLHMFFSASPWLSPNPVPRHGDNVSGKLWHPTPTSNSTHTADSSFVPPSLNFPLISWLPSYLLGSCSLIMLPDFITKGVWKQSGNLSGKGKVGKVTVMNRTNEHRQDICFTNVITNFHSELALSKLNWLEI